MNDKRHAPDRRSWAPTHFPLRDREGYLVMSDRRYRPDRRLERHHGSGGPVSVLLFPKTVVADIRTDFAIRGMLVRVTRRQRTRVYRVSFTRHERLRCILKAHPHLAEGSVFHQVSFHARLSSIAGIREARSSLHQQRPFV